MGSLDFLDYIGFEVPQATQYRYSVRNEHLRSFGQLSELLPEQFQALVSRSLSISAYFLGLLPLP